MSLLDAAEEEADKKADYSRMVHMQIGNAESHRKFSSSKPAPPEAEKFSTFKISPQITHMFVPIQPT